MKKYFLLAIIALQLNGAASDKPAFNWLILGASDIFNKKHFDSVFDGLKGSWKGFDQMCSDESSTCIKGDFNSLTDLNKIPDNHYDVIYFDDSTVKFTHWDIDHLQVLAKKLKDPGLLLIPKGGSGTNIPFPDGTSKTGETIFRQMVSKFAPLREAHAKPDVFINGGNLLGVVITNTKPEVDLETSRKLTEYVIPKALSVLKKVFTEAEYFTDEDKPAYPPLSRPYYKIYSFYAALKNSDRSLDLKKAYDRLIIEHLPKSKTEEKNN